MADSTTKPEHEGPTEVGLVAHCSRCGEPRPPNINHIWACCGDGPGYGDYIKPESLACVKRQLRAAESELAAERARVRELKAQAQRDTGLLLNLLARIHGDGGHRVIAVGVEQACAEADLMVAKWRAVGRK